MKPTSTLRGKMADTTPTKKSLPQRSHISTPLPHPFPAALPPKAARRLMEPPKSGWPDPPRKILPPWDRLVDIVYHKYQRGQRPFDVGAAFEKAVKLFFADYERTQNPIPSSLYLRLPAVARLKICQDVVAHHSDEKPISLNRNLTTREVWTDDEFASLASALESLRPYLAVSFAFRADLMVAFLMTERFHVTFSPFVNPSLDRIATLWCNRYGHFMHEIVLELDMSRFGLGPGKQAHKLRPGTGKIDILIKAFVKTQLKRSSPLKSLVLLCRRFYGQRFAITTLPAADESTHTGKGDVQKQEQTSAVQRAGAGVYYCPEEALKVCETLVQLEGLIDSMRIVGFSDAYTHSLLRRIFTVPENREITKRHTYRVAPSTLWPRFARQSSWIDSGRGKPKLDDHSKEYLSGLHSPEGAIQLPPPYVDPVTGLMSIRPPPKQTDGVSEAGSLSDRSSSRMQMVARNSKDSDAESLEKRVQGLVHNIRRSISRRESDARASLERTWLNASQDTTLVGKDSLESDDSRRHSRQLISPEKVDVNRSLVKITEG